MNLLNEEIRVIQASMTHLKRAIPLATDNGERLRLEKKYKEFQQVLEEKLNNCEDYKG